MKRGLASAKYMPLAPLPALPKTHGKIPKEVQEFLTGKMAWVAKAASDGMPNATPKGSDQLIDDEHVAFADLFSRKTRKNLLANAKVSITVADQTTYKGYQIKGSAEILDSAPLFDRMSERLKKAPIKLPPPLQ